METLESIRDICDRYECCDGCPFLEKADDSGYSYCLLEPPVNRWDLEKIGEGLKNVTTS